MSEKCVQASIVVEDESILEIDLQPLESEIIVEDEVTLEALECVDSCVASVELDLEAIIEIEHLEEFTIVADSEEAEVIVEDQVLIGPPGPPGEAGEPGEPGPPGEAGLPGGYEIVPITITAVNVWTPVPLAVITTVADVEVFDQSNQEKVVIDIRILMGNNVEIRSKTLRTFNVHITGI